MEFNFKIVGFMQGEDLPWGLTGSDDKMQALAIAEKLAKQAPKDCKAVAVMSKEGVFIKVFWP